MATSYESDNQLYDRVMPSIIEMNQFVSLRVPSVQSSLKETATAAKRAAAFGEKILKERVASPEMLRELDRLVSVVKAQYGYRITQRGASFSRPGAKAEMAMTDVQRKAGYKWRVAYTKQLGKDQYLGGPPVTIEDDLLFATESAARQWADAMLKKGWFKGQGGGPEKVMKATVLMASRPDAKAKMAAHPENIAWMRSLPASVVNQVRGILQKPHSSARAKALRDALKAGGVGFNQFVPDASAGAEVLGHQFREAFAKPEVEETEEQKAGLKLMAASDEAVSNKIRTLIKEGKPQDQAVAIALDMKRRGEL